MNYKILIPLFVFGAVIYSCKKDSSSPGGSGSGNNNTNGGDQIISSYQAGDLLLINQLAIYTNTGVTSDPAAVQKFLNVHAGGLSASKFYVGQNYVTNPFVGYTLNFLNGQRVQLNGKTMEITRTNDTMLLVSEYDSLDVPAAPVTQCDFLEARVPSITPYTFCPGDNCSRFRKTYPISVVGNAYYLPFLYFIVSNSTPGQECSSVADELPMQNMLNPDFPSTLGPNDSVLVQIARLPMSKKVK
jgi:hypothetical protein